MFSKMFGGTEEMQMQYLKPRVIATAADLVLLLIGAIFQLGGLVSTAGGLLAILALVWAWSFMRAWFGVTTLGALFTGNVIFGVVIFVLYIFIGYIFGLIALLIGCGRYIYLLVKRSKSGLGN